MPLLLMLLAGVASATVTWQTMAELHVSHVHCVEALNQNVLFRSNMPVLRDAAGRPYFAHTELLAMMKQRGAGQCGVELPDDVYLTVVSLNNILETGDFEAEKAFWGDEANAVYGEFVNWPLGFHGASVSPIAPDDFTADERRELSRSAVWQIDDVPTQIGQLRAWLTEAPRADGRPRVVLVHCTAGCDRTGQIIGSYMMQYLPGETAVSAYAADVVACGRPPCYHQTKGMQWYCHYLTEHVFKDGRLGNCSNFNRCQPYGCDCMPTQTELPASAQESIDLLRTAYPSGFIASPRVPKTKINPKWPFVVSCQSDTCVVDGLYAGEETGEAAPEKAAPVAEAEPLPPASPEGSALQFAPASSPSGADMMVEPGPTMMADAFVGALVGGALATTASFLAIRHCGPGRALGRSGALGGAARTTRTWRSEDPAHAQPEIALP